MKLFAISSLFLSMSAFGAVNDIQLGQPAYGGTGCPAGSASASISPDGKALSILFDQFVAEAGGTTGKRVDRKNCSVAIPVKIPSGYSVSVYQVDYRGFNSLPGGANATFNVEYFFAGSQGPRYSRTFQGPIDRDFTVKNALAASALVWSPCGAQVILRANTSMTTLTNRYNQQTYSSVDSADFSSGLVYLLQWRRCN